MIDFGDELKEFGVVNAVEQDTPLNLPEHSALAILTYKKRKTVRLIFSHGVALDVYCCEDTKINLYKLS